MNTFNKAFLNGLTVYRSYIVRKDVKPFCYIPKVLLTNEEIFLSKKNTRKCTCKFSCRYSDDHYSNMQQFISLPEYNYINNPLLPEQKVA